MVLWGLFFLVRIERLFVWGLRAEEVRRGLRNTASEFKFELRREC